VSPAQISSSSPSPQRLYLIYHELRTTPTNYAYVTSSADFEQHASLFESRLSPGCYLPEITFDDGHISNIVEALPILLHHKLCAHFFITAGWTGKKAAFMTREHLRELHAAGQRVGAHGFSHTLLTHCSAGELDKELRVARLMLEETLSAPVTTVSLPGGRFNQRVLNACWESGYTQVFTSQPKPEPQPTAPYLGRLNMQRGSSADWIAKLLNPSTDTLLRLRRIDRLKQGTRNLLGDNIYRQLWSLINREEPPLDMEGDATP
jgi:peptidoglycan/xylan/chitin deacetylase (PgdA/CDA1 family)